MNEPQNHNTHWFQPGSFDLLALMTLFGALLFCAGWSFAYKYFSFFHVGILSIDIPYHYFFLYGFWVIMDNIPWLILLSLFYFPVTFSVSFIGNISFLKTARPQKAITGIITIFIIVSSFIVANKLAYKTAGTRYLTEKKNDYISYPNIKVWMKNSGKETEDVKKIHKTLQRGSYRLLMQDSKNLFLFYSFKDNSAAKLPTVTVPLHAVNYMKILPQYKSRP